MIKSQRLGDDILRDDVVILYLIMMPPTVHTAVGGGSPAIPTSNLSIELAVNVKSRILRRSILGGTKFQNRLLFFQIVKKKSNKKLTETRLCDNRLGGVAGFRVAGFVNGNHAELVFHVLDQIDDFALANWVRRLQRLFPHDTVEREK